MKEKNSPYKLLLGSESSAKAPFQRTAQQIQVLTQLLCQNKVISDLKIPSHHIKQICNRMFLTWSQTPHVSQISNQQIYLLLNGHAFEYIQNNSISLKAKLHENNDYLMVRKLVENDYFVVYCPPGRYKTQQQYKKYQLMVDEGTLLGRVSEDLFMRVFMPALEQRWKTLSEFFRKVDIFTSLPAPFFLELARYVSQHSYEASMPIIPRSQKSPFVYFIASGEVEFKTYHQQKKQPNHKFVVTHSKPYKQYLLKQYEVFGMDAFNAETYEEDSSVEYSAEASTDCELFSVEKRILAIVISSFEEELKGKNKMLSSINLNDQIQGQGYQTPDGLILSQNAQKIKTSERKIRDIKLRYLRTSRNSRKEVEPVSNSPENAALQDFKYRSCHNFNSVKDLELKEKFHSTLRSKFNSIRPLTVEKAKVNRIVISSYNDSGQFIKPEEKVKTVETYAQKTTIGMKRKTIQGVSNIGREEGDIIRSYLQKRLKNEMEKKAQIILRRNTQVKKKEQKNAKRIYSLKQSPQIQGKKIGNEGEVGEDLYEIMNKLHQNPLLFKIQSERKKLQSRQKKRKQSRSTKRISKEPKKKEEQGLILIKND